MPRAERRNQARTKRTAEEWIAHLSDHNQSEPEFFAFAAMELYGLNAAEEAAFTANRVHQVAGTRRINLDELLEGLAALDGKTREDARDDLRRLRQAFSERHGGGVDISRAGES